MALPSTPMLDDFSRPDESPLSNQGRWAKLDNGTISTQQVSANRGIATVGEAFSYWTPSPSIARSEAWVVADGTERVGVLLRLNEVGGTNAADGYGMSLGVSSAVIVRYTNFVETTLVSISEALVAGDMIIGRAEASILTFYLIRDGALRQVCAVADSTYASGYVGLYLGGTTSKVTSFGGGAINSVSEPPPMRAGRSRW